MNEARRRTQVIQERTQNFLKETETKIYSSSSSPLAPLLLLSSASSSSSPLPHSEFSSSPLLDTESASEPSPRAFSEIVAIERAVSGVVVCCKVAAAGAWLPRSSVAATAADELSHSRNMSQCIFRTFRSGDNHSAAAGGEEPPPPLITAQGDCRNPRRHAWRSGTDPALRRDQQRGDPRRDGRLRVGTPLLATLRFRRGRRRERRADIRIRLHLHQPCRDHLHRGMRCKLHRDTLKVSVVVCR